MIARGFQASTQRRVRPQCLPERSVQKILLRSRPRGILEFVGGIAALYGFCDGFLGCHSRSFLLSSCLILSGLPWAGTYTGKSRCLFCDILFHKRLAKAVPCWEPERGKEGQAQCREGKMEWSGGSATPLWADSLSQREGRYLTGEYPGLDVGLSNHGHGCITTLPLFWLSHIKMSLSI